MRQAESYRKGDPMDKDPGSRCDGSPVVRLPHPGLAPAGHERAATPIEGRAHRTPACGRLLKELRIRQGLGIEEVLAECAAQGVAVGESEYREIEAGVRLPDDFAIFVDAVALSLSLSADEQVALLREFAFAILREELGDDVAASILGM
jgi:hypothetical protein